MSSASEPTGAPARRQRGMVRSWREGRLHPPVVGTRRRLYPRGVRRSTGDRDSQLFFRAHAVQLSPPRAAEAVKRGVWQAGGFPLEFPTMSLGETLIRPTAMLFRNLMAMEVEESLRANPLDGVVLLCGCDKTTPAMLMAAASVDLPAIVVTGGPMLNGRYKGGDLGSGTAVWNLSEELRAGRLSEEDFSLAESCMSRSHGHCMTMGTASTMACMVEALGMSLPGSAAVPAVDAGRFRIAQASGQRIVAMVAEEIRPSRVLTGTPSRTQWSPTPLSVDRPTPSFIFSPSPADPGAT